MSTTIALSPATAVSSASSINRINHNTSAFGVSSRSSLATRNTMRRMISCQVALKSSNSMVDNDVSSSSPPPDENEEATKARIGAKVKVIVPLKVYHVPKVAEVDLTGMEGHLKLYVGWWKGKNISANLPYKVEFFTEVEGRGSVKFFAHLKEDEFDYID